MRVTCPQYNYYESIYRIAGKHFAHHQYKNSAMRMTTATSSTMTPRIHRKGFRTPSKRHPGKVLPGKLHSISRIGPGKIAPGKRINPRPHPPPCDNSNDSGFGFDQHVEIHSNSGNSSSNNSNHHQQQQQQQIIRTIPTTRYLSTTARGNVRAALKRPTIPIQSNITTSSKDESIQLQIISQPEQQHRARYQTEGSRGAVKDRSGNGFPIVKLVGYNKAAVLQVFIGTDIGRVAPHMFYQACKVAGKNSTPCTEKKVDGTMIIEIEFKPENDMTITCDCVGILKERNVDVEHRFPDHSGQRSKKKSTRCRMVFRTQLTHDDGTVETLQVCSYPIICTQPPGVPEICKKSLTSCPVDGGLELFIIGKNFLKDTCVVFRDGAEGKSQSQNDISRLQQNTVWEQTVFPDKEYLQQTHLVCTVPPYIHQNIIEPITVHLFVMSSGKRSEAQTFIYTPQGAHSVLSAATSLNTLHGTLTNQQDSHLMDNNAAAAAAASMVLWGSGISMEPKSEIDSGMMPPPATLPLGVGRRPSTSNSSIISAAATAAVSTNVAITDSLQPQPIGLKTEIMDESSQSSTPETMHTESSLDQFPSAIPNGNVTTVAAERIRKQSIDIIDMHSISLMNNANSMSGFPPTATTTTMHAVKQEELSSQLQSQILSVAAAAQVAVQTAQDQQTVNKFLSSLDSNMTDLKPTVTVDSSVNTLFGNNPVNSTNSNGIFSQPSSINNIEMLSAATPANLESTFPQSILSNNNPSNNLNQIISMSQNDSPKAVHSPSSSSSSSTNIHSPVTQDIILNSEPAASIQSANMQMMQPTQTANATSTEHITSELILNPTVSPSIMCPPSSDPNNLIVNQVTIANTILNEMNLAHTASQNPQEQILNTMMINSHSNAAPNHMDKNAQAVTTVNNMILKAAADFITNQERGAISTESTLNALMSLNSTPILNDSQSAVSQILNQIPTNSSQTTSTSPPVLTRNDATPSSQATPSQTRLDIMQPPPPSQSIHTSSTMPRHIAPGPHFNEQNVISNPAVAVNINSLSTAALSNLLMNQDVVRNAAAQNEFLHNLQKSSTIPPTENQESLLQAVSLTRNGIEKAKNDGTVEQLTISQTVNLNQGNSSQSTSTAAIPQEITTMSEQDLISYINPSCFDQV